MKCDGTKQRNFLARKFRAIENCGVMTVLKEVRLFTKNKAGKSLALYYVVATYVITLMVNSYNFKTKPYLLA